MFKLILTLLIIFLILFFLIIWIIIQSNNRIEIFSDKVKYNPSNNSKRIFEKNGITATLNEVTSQCLFYCLEDWSIKNNNYINVKDRYYILEKGYYYYILNKHSLIINNNCKIILLDINNNKISFNKKND